ncbi:major facilitator superfamily domain-containing protein [Lineolata rhizophorae]|uniref:Major facilitator superfamily domain-containing protein n=1 Tax=Lineolata rhizophorae TaxID=578093 RepID=A0A6A6P632_9PEZI|nr:major facilitator superfamily domain-containing protein [Lineolata rhizophorae]
MSAAGYHLVHQVDDDDRGDGIELDTLGTPRRCFSRAEPEYLGRIPSAPWLIPFFFANGLAFGISAVPRLNLVVSMICQHVLEQDASQPKVVVGGENPQCSNADVSSATALFVSGGNAISAVLAATMCAVLGRLSDRVGRVKIMAVNTCGILSSDLVLIMLAKWPGSFDYRWLLLAFILDGLSGSFGLDIAMGSSYISDCAGESSRTVLIGRIHGTLSIGAAVGPLISSFLVTVGGNKHPLLPYYAALATRLMSIAYLRFIPESLPRVIYPHRFSGENAQSDRLNHGNTLRDKLRRFNPRAWLNRIVPPSTTNARLVKINVGILLFVNILIFACLVGISEVLILYPQVKFNWGNVENNLFIAIINGFTAMASTIFLPVLVRLFRKQGFEHKPRVNTTAQGGPDVPRTGADILDRVIIQTSMLFDVVGFIGFATSPNGVLFTLSGALTSFWAVGLATTQATLTKHVTPERTGEMMGGLFLIQSLVRIIAQPAVNWVYSVTVKTMAEVSFLGVSTVLCAGLIVTVFLRTDVFDELAASRSFRGG